MYRFYNNNIGPDGTNEKAAFAKALQAAKQLKINNVNGNSNSQ